MLRRILAVSMLAMVTIGLGIGFALLGPPVLHALNRPISDQGIVAMMSLACRALYVFGDRIESIWRAGWDVDRRIVGLLELAFAETGCATAHDRTETARLERTVNYNLKSAARRHAFTLRCSICVAQPVSGAKGSNQGAICSSYFQLLVHSDQTAPDCTSGMTESHRVSPTVIPAETGIHALGDYGCGTPAAAPREYHARPVIGPPGDPHP